MKLLRNVFKARAVTVDSDNIVSIKIMPAAGDDAPVKVPEDDPPEESPQELVRRAGIDAEQILQKARMDAEALFETAKRQAMEEAEALKAQAREEGYREGCQEAAAEGERIKAQAEKVLSDAKRERAEMEASLEPEMVRLIIDIVSKLLGDTVRLNPAMVVNLIRQGLTGATLTGDVSIHVSPHDYEAVTENKEMLSALTDSSVRLDIVRDPSLNAMDCVIETPLGDIDCSLNQQYDALRDNLTYIAGAAG